MPELRSLYPEIEPNRHYELKADGHHIYYEESGDPQGIPVIFLHGGPGSGSNENHRRYFDPKKYRIINFDQRGCNRSSPRGSVESNTTQYLLNDMEQIREQLGIDRWLIFAGSWGAALGLLYAQAQPEWVLGLVLRGTFLAREADLSWFAQSGVNRVFPDDWENFIRDIPAEERNDLVSAYYKRVHEGDDETQRYFARAWSEWAGKVVSWTLDEIKQEEEDIELTLDQVRIETHYASHRYFIKENQILDNVKQLPAVPVAIIHGRRDLTCALESSWSLHKALPESELVIVREGGHLAGEPPMIDALIRATDQMAERLS
jgi:proline iminopeptidase